MFKNKLAFSLVELVVVIAIMAILAGAVAGAVVGVRENANKSAVTTAASELKTQWGLLVADSEVTTSDNASAILTKLSGKLTGVNFSCTGVTSGANKKPTDAQVKAQQDGTGAAAANSNYMFIANTTSGVTRIWVFTKNKMCQVTCYAEDGRVEIGAVQNYNYSSLS